MAHNLEIRNGKASFAAVGEIAWHGLGTYVENAMTAEEAIKNGGLDYTVEKTPIFTGGGDNFIPHLKAITRTDTGDVFGICRNAYQIIQNTECFDFFDTIVERGEAIFQTAGVLGKGEKFFVTAKLPEDITVHGEQVNNYLLLTAGHDTLTPISIGFTGIRVVCNNTLTAALRGLKNRVTIMHFKNAKEKLAAAAKVMGLASKYTVELEQAFNKMASVKITDEKLRKYIIDVMKTPEMPEAITKEDFEKYYSKQFASKVDSIMEFALTHDTQLTDAAQGTVWGAYNAISGYHGWVKEYGSAEKRMTDIMYGAGNDRIVKAFDLAAAMC